MNCPVCGIDLKMVGIQEYDGFALVRRSCHRCGVIWILRHQENSIVSVTQEGMEMGDYGFDYKCPHCGFESTVYTVLQTSTGWKCLSCGKIVPQEYLKPRGDFVVAPRIVVAGARRSSRSRSTPGYQRAPRTSKPIPDGAVTLAAIAQELNVEPKKLRSWLRKVGWRSSEEVGSSWVFSPKEVEDLKVQFRRYG